MNQNVEIIGYYPNLWGDGCEVEINYDDEKYDELELRMMIKELHGLVEISQITQLQLSVLASKNHIEDVMVWVK